MLLGLFADGVDPHTLGGGALSAVLILIVVKILETWERNKKASIESEEKKAKAELESRERLAKIEADKAIAAKAAELDTKVRVLESSQIKCDRDNKEAIQKCENDRAVITKKLDECQQQHMESAQRGARQDQDIEQLKKTVSLLNINRPSTTIQG